MELNDILAWLNVYGYLFILVISFLEHLNLPGFPAAIVYPSFGFWAVSFDKSIFLSLTLGLVASVAGAIILYYVGYYGGNKVIDLSKNKFKKAYTQIIIYEEKLKKQASKVTFIANILPFVRTIIAIPCGIVKMKLSSFILMSSISIMIYNTVFFFIGYFLGEVYFNYL